MADDPHAAPDARPPGDVDRPAWQGPASLAALAAVFLCLLGTGLILGAGHRLQHLPDAAQNAISLICVQVAGTVTALLVLGTAVPPADWLRELRLLPLSGRVLARGVGLFCLAMVAIYAVENLLELLWQWRGWPSDEQQAVSSLLHGSSVNFLVMAVAAVLIAPPCEELLFRLVIHQALRRRLSEAGADVGSAALFAGIHFSVQHALPLFLLALCLQQALRRSGSLWLPILLHAGFNAWGVALIAHARFTGG